METQKKWSKAFSAYMDNFVNVLKGSDKNPEMEDGNKKFYFKGFETHAVKDSEFKESTFSLCEKGGKESVNFTINSAGTLKGAEYVNFENYNKDSAEKGKGVVSVWVGKDTDKLNSLVKSDGLKSVLAEFDWSKSVSKEAEAEADGPEIS